MSEVGFCSIFWIFTWLYTIFTYYFYMLFHILTSHHKQKYCPKILTFYHKHLEILYHPINNCVTSQTLGQVQVSHQTYFEISHLSQILKNSYEIRTSMVAVTSAI